MQLATLQSYNPDLDGEPVKVFEEDYRPGIALVTLVKENVVFLWPKERLQLEPDSLSLQTQASCHAQSKT
jgi:hypothetical protein